MVKKTYAEKLQDPRWQKKRLEIMQRDGFKCTKCGNTKSTLHVHHKRYTFNDPWKYDNNDLTTLCDKCHKEEHYEIKVIEGGILKVADFIKKHPTVTKLFTKIENHEGAWYLTLHEKARFQFPYLYYTQYQNKVFGAIYNLKRFIELVDRHIFIISEQDGRYFAGKPLIHEISENNIPIAPVNFYDFEYDRVD